MIVLGSDPGLVNYGYGVINVRERNGKLRINIKSAGQLHWTIANLTAQAQKPPKSKRKKKIPMAEQMVAPLHSQMKKFKADWAEHLDEYEPEAFFVERWQVRGFGGKQSEVVSVMNGVLASMADDREMHVEMITAASWKYHVNQHYSLDALYQELQIPNHIVDANFIALYGALKAYRIPWKRYIVDAMLDELDRLVYEK